MTKSRIKILLGLIVGLFSLFGPISITVHIATEEIPTTEHITTRDSVYAEGETPNPAPTNNTTPPANGSTNTNSSTGGTAPQAAAGSTAGDLEYAQFLEGILKVLYVIMWPFLWIAGLAMDNSLVYGEFFHLDKALYQFWGIMKNFANFFIGFIFVWKIIKYILDIKGGKEGAGEIGSIIKNLFIATVLVQASWFIMGALIDLSTVLTVGVGALPLKLNQTDAYDKPILGIKSSVKLNSKIGTKDNLILLYTRPGSKLKEGGEQGGQYLLPCYIKDNKIVGAEETEVREWFTVFNAAGTTTANGYEIAEKDIRKDYCVLGGNPISMAEYKERSSGEGEKYQKGVKNFSMDYTSLITESRKAIITTACDNIEREKEKKGSVERPTAKSIGATTCSFMGNISKRADGAQGAFYSLYTSLMNLSAIHIAVPKTNTSLTMEALVKILVALAYIIPIITLAIVLIMRVGYLWLIIIFSPFIALSMAGDLFFGKKSFNLGSKLDLSVKNIASLLLLPVYVTFTLSISIVFIASLSEGLTTKGALSSVGIYESKSAGYTCYDVGVTNICIDGAKQAIGSEVLDQFSWLLMNVFGIGLLWFAVMTALKSNQFTAGVVGKIEGLAKNAAMTAPIVPLPGMGATSLGALKDTSENIRGDLYRSFNRNNQTASDVLTGKMQNMMGQDKKIEDLVSKNQEGLTASSKIEDDINSFNNLINPGLWKNLKLGGDDVDGLLAYLNALKKKLSATHPELAKIDDFKSVKEIFSAENPNGIKFLSALSQTSGKSPQELKYLYAGDRDISKDTRWLGVIEAIEKLNSQNPATTASTTAPTIDGSFSFASDGKSILHKTQKDGKETSAVAPLASIVAAYNSTVKNGTVDNDTFKKIFTDATANVDSSIDKYKEFIEQDKTYKKGVDGTYTKVEAPTQTPPQGQNKSTNPQTSTPPVSNNAPTGGTPSGGTQGGSNPPTAPANPASATSTNPNQDIPTISGSPKAGVETISATDGKQIVTIKKGTNVSTKDMLDKYNVTRPTGKSANDYTIEVKNLDTTKEGTQDITITLTDKTNTNNTYKTTLTVNIKNS